MQESIGLSLVGLGHLGKEEPYGKPRPNQEPTMATRGPQALRGGDPQRI